MYMQAHERDQIQQVTDWSLTPTDLFYFQKDEYYSILKMCLRHRQQSTRDLKDWWLRKYKSTAEIISQQTEKYQIYWKCINGLKQKCQTSGLPSYSLSLLIIPHLFVLYDSKVNIFLDCWLEENKQFEGSTSEKVQKIYYIFIYIFYIFRIACSTTN